MLNKQKGNMYGFVTHTWNVVKGKCPHDCEYCYMKIFPQGQLHFDKKELKTSLGEGNFIFVGSSCDMFAKAVPDLWIREILNYCREYNNTYLFQTKNPIRFSQFKEELERLPHIILGTTIETNRQEELNNNAPTIEERKLGMIETDKTFNCPIFITIEPIIDFDLDILTEIIREINPNFVNIGADSKNHNLVEPKKEKVEKLINNLKLFTEVRGKENLGRLLE